MMDKLCRECGKDVKQKRSTKEFCSVACHDEWWRKARMQAAKMSQLLPCLCEVCRDKVTNWDASDKIRQQSSANETSGGTASEETTSGP